MQIVHYRPPSDKGKGGLNAAIDSLLSELDRSGCSVTTVQEPGTAPDCKADLHHFHGLWIPWHSQIAKQLHAAQIPYMVSPHGMLEPWAWRHKLWKKLPYFLLREHRYLAQAKYLIATAPPEAANLQQRFPQQCIKTIPLGLTDTKQPSYAQARSALGIDDSKSTLLYFSRLHEKKGADLLLKAVAQMNIKSFCRLIIVGDGEPYYVSRLHDFAEANSHRLPEITWVGPVWDEKKWLYLQAADLFCLPTHSENFGLAVLEALQVGTRILTTHGTPWPQLITDQSAAFFVKPEIEAIQQGIMKFLRNRSWTEEQRRQLATWTHDKFSWPRIIDDYQQVCRAAMSR